jgi:adenosylcobinamide kinase/adenosylcobinamide-phosphate guanylyltransferase
LLSVLKSLPGDVVFVSNEVGQGVVPMGELTRKFVDEAGLLHQDLAKICESVLFVVAGLPQFLKQPTA